MRKIFNLTKFRKEHGFTQQELAKKLNVTQSDISNYEANTDIIPFRVIIQLARIFKLSNFNDFFNEEQITTPICTPDVFNNLRNIRKEYQTKIYNDDNHVDFETYLNFFIIERPIYQQIHKPLVLIKAEYEDVQRDFISALTKMEFPAIKKNIPIFISDNEERPLFSTENIVQKEFPWIMDEVLYFRKTKHSPIFDISMSCCPAYALPTPNWSKPSYWKNSYTDYFLNIPPNIDETACAVIYFDCSLLKNCNIALHPNDNQKFAKSLEETADIILDLNNKKNGTNVTLIQSSTQTKEDYLFSFSENKINTELYTSINSTIQKICNKIQKDAPTTLKAYFKTLHKNMQDQSETENYSETDYNKAYSQYIIWKNNVTRLLNNIKNESIKIFDKEYTDFTEVKNIESLFLKLGKKTYKNDLDKQNTFPCNLEDLEKSKKKLLTTFSDKYSSLINKSFISFSEQLQELCDAYECETFLKSIIQEFSKAITTSLTDDNQHFDDVAKLYLSTFKNIIPNTSKAISIYDNQNNEINIEKIFFEALKDIITFSRGFSLSKARKISKALQNFQVHNSFLKILNEYWEQIETLINAIIADFLGNFYNEIPPNSDEFQKINEQRKKIKSIIADIKEL